MTGGDRAMATAALRTAAKLVDELPPGAFRDSDLNAAAERLLAVLEARVAPVTVPDLDVFDR